MDILIEEIVKKLNHLSEVRLLEVLDFVEFLTWSKERSTSQPSENNISFHEEEAFETIADRLADEFSACVGANVPILSNYAVSRAGIYEEHP